MKALARLSVRRRWLVLIFWIVLFVGINILSQTLGSAYSNTFTLPGTNSIHAQDLLTSAFHGQSGDVDEIVYQSHGGPITSHEAAIVASLSAITHLPKIASVSSPFCSGIFSKSETLADGACRGAAQVSTDGTIAYAIVHFTQPGFKLKNAPVKTMVSTASTLRSASLDVQFAGPAIGNLYGPKGSKGEIFGLIATAIVLVFAFGSFFAMLLPLGVALFALGIAMAATVLLSHGLAIADFAPILGSLIGLGVGIDYALFIVTRARQELKRGRSVEEAVVTAVNTSGRAVLFAGSTVVVALLGMLAVHFSALNGVAVSAAITVAITMFASLTLLPSLLGFWKLRILSRKERRRLREDGPEPLHPSGPWQRWAVFVSRHPRSLSLAAFAVIALVAIPVFSLQLGSSDQGSDPVGSTTRQAYDLLATGFGPGFNGPLAVVGEVRSAKDLAAMQTLATTLKSAPGVQAVEPLAVSPNGKVAVLDVVATTSPESAQTTGLITTIRDVYIPRVTASSHTPIYVGGLTAIYADFANVLSGRIPLFLGIIVLLGCLLLMVAFRSVLVPLTAAVMNLLAVAASFGLVVAVFQWGWGSSLIQAGTGPVESFLPIIMIAILFGLSMDYQVFLVSRMHEEWTNSHENEVAIVRGQANTGRVITAAALIMISVFFSFAFGGQRIIAEFGIGLGGAVLLDAFVLRTVLVPALMHFLGRWNWWMPAWLERIVPHLAVEASGE